MDTGYEYREVTANTCCLINSLMRRPVITAYFFAFRLRNIYFHSKNTIVVHCTVYSTYCTIHTYRRVVGDNHRVSFCLTSLIACRSSLISFPQWVHLDDRDHDLCMYSILSSVLQVISDILPPVGSPGGQGPRPRVRTDRPLLLLSGALYKQFTLGFSVDNLNI